MKIYYSFVCVFIIRIAGLFGQDIAVHNQMDAIKNVIKSPRQPSMQLNSDKTFILFEHYGASSTSIEKLAEGKVKLAGVSFSTKTGYDVSYIMANRLSLKRVTVDNIMIEIANMPNNPQIFNVKWSPDGGKVAFCNVDDSGVSLWYFDTVSYTAGKILDLNLNFSMENDLYKWHPNSNSLICVSTPRTRVYPHEEIEIKQPLILEHNGEARPNRTYQGLIKSVYEEQLFDYYASSQLTLVDLKGNRNNIGNVGVIMDFDPSPNGEYIYVSYAQKPYSYQYTVYSFPSVTNVYSINGDLVKEIDKHGLLIKGGLSPDATFTGVRDIAWRHDTDATLFWTEALDNGNPDSNVIYRDILKQYAAPFSGEPKELGKTTSRFYDIFWGNDTIAIVQERWWKDRKMKWVLLNPKKGETVKTLAEYSSDALIGIPGKPYMTGSKDHSVLSLSNGKIYLSGFEYDSVHSVLPVLKAFDLQSLEFTEMWRSSPPNFEVFLTFLPEKALGNSDFLFIRQSETVPRNIIKQEAVNGLQSSVTFNKSFLEELDNLQKEDLLYLRKDSVQLYGTLYYKKDSTNNQKLPLLVWAYPVNYKSKTDASEVQTSPYLYTGNYSLQELLALDGFAVLDFAAFPIIGEGDKEPNDTYLTQLRWNAEAALQAVHLTNKVDTNRAAIAGHSYGAFMVANLLTHTNLFKTGIAQSGAYNRSLTPFGFQSEYRTYWEAKELYNLISPFQQADKLQYPILLFHGDKDDNPGTFRFQSERYFEALKGLGKTVRYVNLPYEQHIYQTEETKIFVVEEMLKWLKEYLMNPSSLN